MILSFSHKNSISFLNSLKPVSHEKKIILYIVLPELSLCLSLNTSGTSKATGYVASEDPVPEGLSSNKTQNPEREHSYVNHLSDFDSSILLDLVWCPNPTVFASLFLLKYQQMDCFSGARPPVQEAELSLFVTPRSCSSRLISEALTEKAYPLCFPNQVCSFI